jgi:nitrite reductase/ring-hydroxylating ferredoxin subunit
MRHLCSVTDLPVGVLLTVQLEGLPDLLVCQVDGTFHVVEATCSHGAVPLAEGRVLGCEIECPLHAGRFDLTTGAATRRPAKKPIQVFTCVVEDGELYLQQPGVLVEAAPAAHSA